jgi:hypothetical protein
MMPPLSPPMSMLWIRVLSADHVRLKNAHICKPPAFSNSPTLKLGGRGGAHICQSHRSMSALNPKTKRPFSKSTVYLIFQEDCYDDAPFLPWVCKARFSKTALAHGMMERRLKLGSYRGKLPREIPRQVTAGLPAGRPPAGLPAAIVHTNWKLTCNCPMTGQYADYSS